jgi:nitrite reductase/ring-hydroxylating ferredoxin subunit/uncharacterized membrane protein
MTIGVAEREMAEAIGQQGWLEPVDQALGQAVSTAFGSTGPAGRQVQNFLHGTWLGHPLHPVLTDAPIGAWTTAMALDALESLTGRKEVGPGADAAIGFGLLTAVGAALAGVTDWHVTSGRARKVGLLHGLLNLTAAGIYTASWISRKRGARAAGRGLALAGFAIANYSAFLGGHLVYAERLGVDHSRDETAAPPEDFVPVLGEAELTEGQLRRADANGVPVLLARTGGRTYALGNVCVHLGCSLADGQLEEESVRCPCHGSRYALADGRVLDGPATMPQPLYETRTRNGQVEVRIAQA